jgi:flagellar motor switch protein FliN/FliY
MTDANELDKPNAAESSDEQPEAGSVATPEMDDSVPAEGSADNTPDDVSSDAVDAAPSDAPESAEIPDKVVNEDDASEDDAEEAMLKMLEDLPSTEEQASPDDIDFSSGGTSVSNASFQHLSEPAGDNEHQNIDLLMDVKLPVAIELGHTKMPISDILALGPGSVVELNKLAGEPVDLLVNNKVVAKGEVVVVDENFGLRITQLMTPEERLKSLGEE